MTNDNDTTTEPPENPDARPFAPAVADAVARLKDQNHAALTEAWDEDELKAEIDLARYERKRRRERRRTSIDARSQAADDAEAAALAAEAEIRKADLEAMRADIRDLAIARKAIAQQRRTTSPHARVADLHNHRKWANWALIGVVLAGMGYSATNVQHNLAPGGTGDPLYWFSYLLEAMISVCLVVVMLSVPKITEAGVELGQAAARAGEVALLALTMALNTFPYFQSDPHAGQHPRPLNSPPVGGGFAEAWPHAVAPVMIGVAMGIHTWLIANKYGEALTLATAAVPGDGVDLPRPRYRAAERIDSPIDPSGPRDRTDTAALEGGHSAPASASAHIDARIDAESAPAAGESAHTDESGTHLERAPRDPSAHPARAHWAESASESAHTDGSESDEGESACAHSDSADAPALAGPFAAAPMAPVADVQQPGSADVDPAVLALAQEIRARALSAMPVDLIVIVLVWAGSGWVAEDIADSLRVPVARVLGVLDAAERIRSGRAGLGDRAANPAHADSASPDEGAPEGLGAHTDARSGREYAPAAAECAPAGDASAHPAHADSAAPDASAHREVRSTRIPAAVSAPDPNSGAHIDAGIDADSAPEGADSAAAELRELAEEIRRRRPRTQTSVEDIARVLLVSREPDKHNKHVAIAKAVDMHRDTVSKILATAAEIEQDQAAEATVVNLHHRR